MSIRPIVNFNRGNNDSADLFCNCPNCKDIIGKITYGYRYEGGVALEGFKTCRACEEPIDWTAVVNRFQINPMSTYDLEFKEQNVSLGTKAPKKFPNNMDKCMAILNSLKEGADKYLTSSEKEPEIEQVVENVVERLLTPITEEMDEIERD